MTASGRTLLIGQQSKIVAATKVDLIGINIQIDGGAKLRGSDTADSIALDAQNSLDVMSAAVGDITVGVDADAPANTQSLLSKIRTGT